MNITYCLFGLLVGFLVGLTGMGGGSLMTPLLILLLHVKPTVAVGTDIAYAAITKIIGGYIHCKQNTVNGRLAWRLAAGSVPGGLCGVWCVRHLQNLLGDNVQHLIVRLLGLMLIAVAVTMFLNTYRRLANWRENAVFRLEGRFALVIVVGFVLGFLVGITSIGSGTLFGALLIYIGLTPREMVGTDVYHAAILTSFLAVGQMIAGNVDYSIVGNILVGSLPGVILGSLLTTSLPEKLLRPALASVLFFTGVKMAEIL